MSTSVIDISTLPVEQVAEKTYDNLLHITAASIYPLAFCGATVKDPLDFNRTDTAGRDRCTNCMAFIAKHRHRD